jgi:hypothetical protein
MHDHATLVSTNEVHMLGQPKFEESTLLTKLHSKNRMSCCQK